MRQRAILLFTLPALAIYGAFGVFPLLSALRLSFTNFTGVGVATWIGVANYATVLGDAGYRRSLWVTLAYTAIVVVVQNGLGLLFAALVHSVPRLRGFTRVALLVPSMFSFVIAGFVWQYLYSPLGGGVNALLEASGLQSWELVWLGAPTVALLAVTLVHVWMFVGYSTAVFLTGYAGIPQELREAARIDGGSAWQRFWQIDFPLLAPAVTVNVTLSTIGTLKTFELPFVLTNGGPDGATTTVGLQTFKSLFEFYDFGVASALSVVALVLTAVIVMVQGRVLRAREERI